METAWFTAAAATTAADANDAAPIWSMTLRGPLALSVSVGEGGVDVAAARLEWPRRGRVPTAATRTRGLVNENATRKFDIMRRTMRRRGRMGTAIAGGLFVSLISDAARVAR
jgi:hypothetical protein